MSPRRSPRQEPSAAPGAVGHRIATARERAGLTRRHLADAASLSAGLLTEVERGDRPASPSLTAATARALGLDVETLHGQPYGPALCDPGAEHAGVPALRAALHSDDDPQPPPGAPLTAAQLRVRLDDCDRDRAGSRYASPDQCRAAFPVNLAAVPTSDERPGIARPFILRGVTPRPFRGSGTVVRPGIARRLAERWCPGRATHQATRRDRTGVAGEPGRAPRGSPRPLTGCCRILRSMRHATLLRVPPAAPGGRCVGAFRGVAASVWRSALRIPSHGC
ncbi:MAG: helix-turn-helix domain-containing protein [Pseudonocardiaceae bacterium]